MPGLDDICAMVAGVSDEADGLCGVSLLMDSYSFQVWVPDEFARLACVGAQVWVEGLRRVGDGRVWLADCLRPIGPPE